jgi:phosphate transport system permease protein
MAVTMVIGNNPRISLSLLAPQETMAAVLANEFTEAADELFLDALIEVGLVLFIITLIVNIGSRMLILQMNRPVTVRKRVAVTASVGEAA